VPQLFWQDILEWIHGRFNDYRREKEDHRQWQEVGKMLYSSACGEFSEDRDAFVRHWLRRMRVTATNDA
jgi:hypothetical protein